MLIATIVGNRPQFVKAAGVSRLLRECAEEVLIHTGQHYDDELSRVFFEELGVPAPDVELGRPEGDNSAQTAAMLAALAPRLGAIAPDLVVVYGDTNSTLAGVLAAAQADLPVAHVEAGLRSYDRAMPEELNRVLTDHAADLLLCPTAAAMANLEREGLADRAHLVGDVMADVSLAFASIAQERSDVLERLGLSEDAFLLATAHRAGNVDDPERLERLVALLEGLPDTTVVALHPRTAARLHSSGLRARLDAAPHLRVTGPLGYLDFLVLAHAARAVLTDSGGVQKEAYLLGTRCLTLRDSTEWVETVQAGWNRLVDLDREVTLAALAAPPPAGERPDLYGGGHAGERIRDLLYAYTGPA